VKSRSFIGVLFFAVAAFAARGQASWLYVLPADGAGLFAVDGSGNLRSIRLSLGAAAGVFPTPGGKFVFVRHEGSRELTVVDAERLEEHAVITVQQGVPEAVAFAPTGEKAYVSLAGSGRVLVYDHRRGALTFRLERQLGSPGAPLLLNRRGTRLYRSGAGGARLLPREHGRDDPLGGPAARSCVLGFYAGLQAVVGDTARRWSGNGHR